MADTPPPGAKIAHRQQFRRCGKAGCPRCQAGQPGHGPYWYATWWADGRAHTRYVGKQLPDTPTDAGSLATSGDGAVAPDPPVAGEPAGPAELTGGDTADQAPAGYQPRSEVPPAGLPSPADPDALRVQTLGGFAVWRGEELIPSHAWSRRKQATALFKHLLRSAACRVPREELMDTLWPAAEPAAATANLRYTVHLLRKLLDRPAASWSHLRIELEVLALLASREGAAPATWLDAAAFEQSARLALNSNDPAACAGALARYAGDYLPDDPYGAWADERRTELRLLRLSLLLHQSDLCVAQQDSRGAVHALQEVLAFDPSHEPAARALLRLQAAGGRRTEAMATYRRLVEALRRDLDLEPEAETRALYAGLLAGTLSPVMQPAALADTGDLRPVQPVLELRTAGAPPVLGRQAEQAALDQLVRHTAQGRGGLLLLSGGAGIGKSMLLTSFLRSAEAQGALVLAGRAYRQEGRLPYGPLQDALRSYVRVQPSALLEEQTTYHAVLVRLLPELGRLLPGLPTPAPLEPKGERHRLFAALGGLLEDLARRLPVVLALEDLHWADTTTIQALHYLQRTCASAPIVLIGTLRSEDLAADSALAALVARLRTGPTGSVLDLQPLDAASIGQLVTTQLAPYPLNAGVLKLLVEKTQGNPLFVRELVGTLQETRALQRIDGIWQLALHADLPLPAGIRAVFLERLGRLDEDAARLARLCAVLDQHLAYPLLGSASELDEEDLLDALESLLQAGVLSEALTQPQAGISTPAYPSYSFQHPLLRESLYQQIPVLRRMQLHRRAAIALASYFGSQADEHAAELFWHFDRAGVHPQAAYYAALAAEQAVTNGALTEAVAHFSAARAHLRHADVATASALKLPTPSEVEERLGDLWLLSGEYVAAQEAFARARAGTTDGARRIELRCKEASSWAKRGEFERGLAVLDASQADALEPIGISPAAQAALLVSRGSLHFQRGAYDAAAAAAEAAITLLHRRGAPHQLAGAYRLLGSVSIQQSNAQQAESYLRQALASWEREPDQARFQLEIARTWLGLGDAAYLRGDLARAEINHRRALAINERIGHVWGVAACWNNLGNIDFVRGTYQAAAGCYERSRAIWERTGDQHLLGHAWNNLGGVALAQGDLPAAERFVERSLAVQERSGSQPGRGICWQNLGDVALARGELALGEERYQRALAILSATQVQETIANSLIGRAGVARARGELPGAAAFCRQARRLGRRHQLPGVEALAALEGARCYLRAGQLRVAQFLFAHGHNLAAERGLARARLQAVLVAAELAIARDDLDAARRHTAHAAQRAVEGPCRREEALAAYLDGRIAGRQGAFELALSSLRLALGDQDGAGFELDAACTRIAIAGILLAAGNGTGPEFQALLGTAQATLRRQGALGDLAYAEQLAGIVALTAYPVATGASP